MAGGQAGMADMAAHNPARPTYVDAVLSIRQQVACLCCVVWAVIICIVVGPSKCAVHGAAVLSEQSNPAFG